MSKTHYFVLQRYSDDGFSTLGLLLEVFTAGRRPLFWGYTLEDELREKKVAGDTRIPTGTYEVKLMRQATPLTEKYRERFPWFRDHLWITGVNGFTGIYIHVGNSDDDTEGCILVGDSSESNQRHNGNDGRILASVNCFQRLYQYLYPKLEAGDRVFLNVQDERALAVFTETA